MSIKLAKAALVCLLVLLPAGCVDRRLDITSEPAGALVYVSSVECGRTPVTIPFTWYGDYEVVLRKEGFEALHTHCKLTTPWYEIPPLDLLSELAPWTYRVHKSAHYKLIERTEITKAELLRRAEQLRARSLEPEE